MSPIDAILGIRDLLARHPKELSFHAVTLVEKLSARIVDVSKSVREVLVDLLRLTIYTGLPQVKISQFKYPALLFLQENECQQC